jgi:hypothetical protein
MRYIIDRIEGTAAVCQKEDGTMVHIDIAGLPADAAEGDVLTDDSGGLMVDKEETDKRRQRIRAKLDKLFK